jgi:hypothetical protein
MDAVDRFVCTLLQRKAVPQRRAVNRKNRIARFACRIMYAGFEPPIQYRHE